MSNVDQETTQMFQFSRLGIFPSFESQKLNLKIVFENADEERSHYNRIKAICHRNK